MSTEPRRECPRCGRPEVTCYCAHVERIATRTKVLVLQHPREEDKAVGTARMAALCLESAEVAVGIGPLPRPLDSGYRGADYDFITAETERGEHGQTSIKYTLDTKRARSEVRAQRTQIVLTVITPLRLVENMAHS